MQKIKAIVMRSDEKFGHMTAISNTLINLQRTVGGYIQTFPVNDKCVVICNEDGRIQGLPYTCTLYTEDMKPIQNFFGDIAVVGVDDDEFTDIPISLQEWKHYIGRDER